MKWLVIVMVEELMKRQPWDKWRKKIGVALALPVYAFSLYYSFLTPKHHEMAVLDYFYLFIIILFKK